MAGVVCGSVISAVWSVYQCSVLSPLFFVLVLEAFARIPHWCSMGAAPRWWTNAHCIADTLEECISKLKRGRLAKKVKTSVLTWRVPSPWSPLLPQWSRQQLYWEFAVQTVGPQEVQWNYWSMGGWLKIRLPQTRLTPSTADQWLKWMTTAPCLMWRPLSATWVTCTALVGAVTVALPPDVAWPGVKVRETLSCLDHQAPLA